MNRYKRRTLLPLVSALLLFALPGCSSERLDRALDLTPEPEVEEVDESVPVIQPVPVPDLPEEEVSTLWQGVNFNEDEAIVLKYLQEYGITDKYALATILGNIKQESRFETRICEGGARTGYSGCHRGGFGLVQWTTLKRYVGLGRFASSIGADPNSIHTQLRYMTSEVEWQQVAHIFKKPGDSINGYMRAAKFWLGWGIHGRRTAYAHDYLNRLTK